MTASTREVLDAIHRMRISEADSELFSTLRPWKRTAAEVSAGVTPVNYAYPPYTGPRTGFIPSATASDNVAALQALIDSMSSASVGKTTADGYPSETWTGPYIEIPDGVYSIDDAVTIPSYCTIRGRRVILVQTDATKNHLECSDPYRLDIEGITFKGGKSALSASGENKDTSRVRIARCNFQTANTSNYAISMSMQTLNMLIEDCLVTNSPLFLDTDGDYVEIRHCWVNGYLYETGLKPDNTASVNNQARYMRVCGGSWVPESDDGVSTGTRWFNNRGGILSLEDVQFGAEGSGGLPIVYEYGDTATGGSPFIANCGTIIRNCQLASGNSGRTDRGVIVLQGSVPAIMDVRGGVFVAFGRVISDAGFSSPTLASWLASNIAGTQYKFSCIVQGVIQEPSSDLLSETVPAALLPFAEISTVTRGSTPGKNLPGPLNYPLTEYDPNWMGTASRVQSAVCGQLLGLTTGSYQNAIVVTKSANAANGLAAAVVVLDLCCIALSSGVYVAEQAQFRITLCAGTTNNIASVVDVVSQNNAAQGGAGPGNVLGCQVTGSSTTTVTIQVRFNAAITIGSLAWRAYMISTTANNGGAGQVFSIASA